MDVAAWLQDLGLERYVSAFRDNDIDAEVLPKLTAEDLISIGVISVGRCSLCFGLDLRIRSIICVKTATLNPAPSTG
jgi:hypothetical protein